MKLNNYQAAVLGTWLGVLIFVPLARYVAIPPLPWHLAIRLGILAGVAATPVFMLCVFLAESTGKRL